MRRTGEIMRHHRGEGMEGTMLIDREINTHKRESTEGRTQETLKGHKRAWKVKTEDTTRDYTKTQNHDRL